MKRILKIAINKTKIKDELQIPKMGFYYDPVANLLYRKVKSDWVREFKNLVPVELNLLDKEDKVFNVGELIYFSKVNPINLVIDPDKIGVVQYSDFNGVKILGERGYLNPSKCTKIIYSDAYSDLRARYKLSEYNLNYLLKIVNDKNYLNEVTCKYRKVVPQSNGLRFHKGIIDEIALDSELNTLAVPEINQYMELDLELNPRLTTEVSEREYELNEILNQVMGSTKLRSTLTDSNSIAEFVTNWIKEKGNGKLTN
jgi:hypothetical protein